MMTKGEIIRALQHLDAPDSAPVVFANHSGELRGAQAVFAARPRCQTPCVDCIEQRHTLTVGIAPVRGRPCVR